MDNNALEQIITMHIKECDSRDVRNSEAFTRIENLFKGIWDAQDKARDNNSFENKEIRAAITNIQLKAASLFGGLTVLGWIFQYYLTTTGKK